MSTSTLLEVAPETDRSLREPRETTVNDLRIRVGTVNGSGSQSANLVLLRALFRMGIPCSGKNVFPSNIEGLPTWFHIRANAKGYVSHRQDPQVLVCMNAQTAEEDAKQLLPGSICIHRDEYELAGLRDDVTFLSVPFQELVEQAYPAEPGDKGYRDKLRKVINMVYVGVVADAVGIEPESIEWAIRREFPGRKAKAADINIAAANRGYEWARANLPRDLPFRVERMSATTGQVLIEGNRASAIGALFGGVGVVTWYPITPSSSLAEYAEDLLKKYRTGADGKRTFAIVQAEDELSAIGMAVGAGWAGARALTATSGPGASLMSEFVGLAYFAEIPVVICDVQRMGPSTGLPTRTSQGDVVKLHLLGHGDCRHIVLIPGSVGECCSLTAQALDIAQRYQTPVFVATDLDLGMNLWLTDPFEYPTQPLDRGKLLSKEDLDRLGGFERYRDVDGDGICQRTVPGTEHPLAAYFTRGTGHNEKSGYSERPEDWKRNLDRLSRKLETARNALPAPEFDDIAGAKAGIIAFGSSHFAVQEARDMLQAEEVKMSYCRMRALPVPDSVFEFIGRHERIYVVEQNRDGHMASLIKTVMPPELASRIVSVRHYSGTPIAAENVYTPIFTREAGLRDVAEPEPDDHSDEPSPE